MKNKEVEYLEYNIELAKANINNYSKNSKRKIIEIEANLIDINATRELRDYNNIKQIIKLPSYYFRLKIHNDKRKINSYLNTQIPLNENEMNLINKGYNTSLKLLNEKLDIAIQNSKPNNYINKIKNEIIKIKLSKDFINELNDIYIKNKINSPFYFSAGTKKQNDILKNFNVKNLLQENNIKKLKNKYKDILKNHKNNISNTTINLIKKGIKNLEKNNIQELDKYEKDLLILLLNDKLIDDNYVYGTDWLNNTDLYKIIPDITKLFTNEKYKSIFKNEYWKVEYITDFLNKIYKKYITITAKKKLNLKHKNVLK